MKKGIVVFLILVLSTTLVSSVFAGGPSEKATGEAWFDTIYGTVHLKFNAHDTDPAKGWVYWNRTAPYANWWSGPVTSVSSVSNTNATFTVSVSEGTPPTIVGCDITFEVHDGGESGIGVDWANITAVTGSSCGHVGQIQNLGYAVAGNIQVHYYE